MSAQRPRRAPTRANAHAECRRAGLEAHNILGAHPRRSGRHTTTATDDLCGKHSRHESPDPRTRSRHAHRVSDSPTTRTTNTTGTAASFCHDSTPRRHARTQLALAWGRPSRREYRGECGVEDHHVDFPSRLLNCRESQPVALHGEQGGRELLVRRALRGMVPAAHRLALDPLCTVAKRRGWVARARLFASWSSSRRPGRRVDLLGRARGRHLWRHLFLRSLTG